MRIIHKLTEQEKQAGKALARWLNDKKIPTQERERVGSIVSDLGSLISSANIPRFRIPNPESLAAIEVAKVSIPDGIMMGLVEGWTNMSFGLRDYDKTRYARVANAIAKYRFRPYLYVSPIVKNVRSFPALMVPEIWVAKEPTSGALRRGRIEEWPTLAVKKKGSVVEQEAWMVLYLMDLSKAGELDRLRHCRYGKCDKWFFALDIRKRTCSDSCHQREWKEAHYAAMTDEEKLKEKVKEKEQNRKHQATYRERTFGPSKKAKPESAIMPRAKERDGVLQPRGGKR